MWVLPRSFQTGSSCGHPLPIRIGPWAHPRLGCLSPRRGGGKTYVLWQDVPLCTWRGSRGRAWYANISKGNCLETKPTSTKPISTNNWYHIPHHRRWRPAGSLLPAIFSWTRPRSLTEELNFEQAPSYLSSRDQSSLWQQSIPPEERHRTCETKVDHRWKGSRLGRAERALETDYLESCGRESCLIKCWSTDRSNA